MSTRYSAYVARLREAVLGSRGVTEPSLRAAIEQRAATLGGRRDPGDAGAPDAVPADIVPLVERIARHAYRVTDDDIAALRRAGYSEDALFEIATSAAVGAGLGRLDRGMAVLRGEA